MSKKIDIDVDKLKKEIEEVMGVESPSFSFMTDEQIVGLHVKEVQKQTKVDMKSEKIILYHGGDRELKVNNIQFPGSRSDCDFGNGFYLTPLKQVAEEWVRNKTNPVINQYILRYSKGYIIHLQGMDWVKVIVGFRKGLYKVKFNYNIVVGAIADDRMNDALPLFMTQGLAGISDKMLFECLSLIKLGDQYVLKTRTDGLEFLKSYTLKGKMLQDAKQRHEDRRRGMTKALDAIRRAHYTNERYISDYIEECKNGITF